MENRSGEPPRLRFRGKRVYRNNEKWYFHTRENISVGPYLTLFEAEVEASILSNILKEKGGSNTKAVILAFQRESLRQANDAPGIDEVAS